MTATIATILPKTSLRRLAISTCAGLAVLGGVATVTLQDRAATQAVLLRDIGGEDAAALAQAPAAGSSSRSSDASQSAGIASSETDASSSLQYSSEDGSQQSTAASSASVASDADSSEGVAGSTASALSTDASTESLASSASSVADSSISSSRSSRRAVRSAAASETASSSGLLASSASLDSEESSSSDSSGASPTSAAAASVQSSESNQSDASHSSSEDVATQDSSSAESASSQSAASQSSDSAASASASAASDASVSSEAEESSVSSDRLEEFGERTIEETAFAEPPSIAPSFTLPLHAEIQNVDELRSRLTLILQSDTNESYEVSAAMEQEENGYRITLSPPTQFRPGRYRLQARLSRARGISRALQRFFRAREDAARDDDYILLDELFDWGLVAFNADTDRYADGETAHVSVALLGQKGLPACTEELSVRWNDQEPVVRPSFCTGEETVALPISLGGSGTMTVSRQMQEREYTTGRRIAVQVEQDDVRIWRDGPVHMLPGAQATMQLRIQSRRLFIGSVTEKVPKGFVIAATNPPARVLENSEGSVILWSGSFGISAEDVFSYTLVAPKTVPLFALFGPAEIEGEMDNPDAIRVEAASSSASSLLPASSSAISETGDLSASSVSLSSSSVGELASSAAPPVSVTSAQSSVQSSSIASSLTSSSAQTSSTASIVASSLATSSAFESSDLSQGTSSAQSAVAADASAGAAESAASSAESAASNAQAEEAGDVSVRGTGFFAGFFRAVRAALLVSDKTLRVTEERQWQMVVAPGEARLPSVQRTLTLERKEAIVPANGSPSFTLVKTDLAEEGEVSQEVALQEILHAVIQEEDVEKAVLETMVEEQASTIAAQSALSRDVQETVADAVGGRVSIRATEEVVRDSLSTGKDAKQKLAAIAATDPAVQQAKQLLQPDSVKEKVIQELTKKQQLDVSVDEAVKAVIATEEPALKEAKDAVLHAVASNPETKEVLKDAVRETGTGQKTAQSESVQSQPVLQLKLTGPNGQVIENPPFRFQAGSVVLVIDPIRSFTPGLYTLQVIVTNPITGEAQSMWQQFAWGVLAMNTDSDVYSIEDTARIDIGVLDDEGAIVCNAALELTVTDPDGEVQVRSTEDDSIRVTGTCGQKTAGFIEPDYTTDLPLGKTGTWSLLLRAEHKNGVRTIEQTIVVQDAPYRISRTGATRLWPMAPSPMDISIEFREAFAGTLVERVPGDFVLSDVSAGGIAVREVDGSQTVRWVGSWKAGTVHTFRYTYDAPDISPQFYIVGPMEFRSDTPPAP